MKKFFAMFLVIAFLMPAFAYAEDAYAKASYCVSFPTSGNSKWTKRDNNINARFRYAYSKYAHDGAARQNELSFAVSTGSNKAYRDYPYGYRDLCIYNSLSAYLANINSHTPFKHVRLDIKWGGDCEKVAMKNGRFTGNHRFEIYRRKGDHINPWGCRRK